MIKKCITSLRILTVIPVPGKDTPVIASSLPFFSVAGVVIGLIMYALFVLLGYISQIQFLGGILLTAALFIVTGGLHFDGFADVCDGFGGGRTKERILEIFKDSRLGTYGVAGLCFDLLTRVMLYSWFIEHHTFAIIGISLVLSRSFQSLVLVFVKPATPGKGIASVFCQAGYKVQVVISNILIVGLSLLLVGNPVVLLIIVGVSLICITLFVLMCIKKIGGLTGDCVGAINEIAEIVILLGGCIAGSSIMSRI